MIKVTDNTFFESCDDEAMILNTITEKYFGLNQVGVDMWNAITMDGSIETAVNHLLKEYDVSEEELRSDLIDLIEKLKSSGLMQEN